MIKYYNILTLHKVEQAKNIQKNKCYVWKLIKYLKVHMKPRNGWYKSIIFKALVRISLDVLDNAVVVKVKYLVDSIDNL